MSDDRSSIEEEYKGEIEEFSDVEAEEYNRDDSEEIDNIELDLKDILSDMSDNIVDIQVGIEVLKREYKIVSFGLGTLVLLNIIVSLVV